MKRSPLVTIVMGSPSDLPTMKETEIILKEFGILCEVKIMSAHRSPDDVALFARQAASRGVRVIIAGAGGAAHLAGVIASHTTLPVIGVPMETGELLGIDSLFSTVQMPSGVPVATVAIGKTGATNAAILAVQILAVHESSLQKKLAAHKKRMAQAVRLSNKKITPGA